MTRSPGSACAVLCGALILAAPGAAGAAPEQPAARADDGGFLLELWARMQDSLDSASAELEPPLRPPQPIEVRWRARRVSSVDLDAPCLAVGAGDLDGDRKAELVALTTREVIALELTGKRKLAILARARLPGEPAQIRPRDPVGAVVVADVDGDGVVEVHARSSETGEAGIFAWSRGAFLEARRSGGFPLGAGALGWLEPGRNYFTATSVTWPAQAEVAPVPQQFYAARWRDDMVDAAGRPLTARGFVATDGNLTLWFHKECRANDDACRANPVEERAIPDTGIAFEFADVNRDGLPEVIISSSAPPGDPDRATVLTLRGARVEKVYRRKFSGGVVGLTAADWDGDGDLDVIAVVRLPGSHRVDVWTLN